MKKLESIMMISRGFNEISTLLSAMAESLDRIEMLLSQKSMVNSSGNDLPDNPAKGGINPNEKLNKAQAAKVLNISVRTLDRYRQKKLIPFYQINGGKVAFRYKDIIALRDRVKECSNGRDHFSELISVSKD
ncbi:MAG: helix-turn-helix domain-containing protein [Prevotella sp.]|jgi:hypothetical protein|nr:helix-turn-helix domain-containing protein [Prevotella sp.]